jgi:DNA invertase Pin-like site-specific DNA recombinase
MGVLGFVAVWPMGDGRILALRRAQAIRRQGSARTKRFRGAGRQRNDPEPAGSGLIAPRFRARPDCRVELDPSAGTERAPQATLREEAKQGVGASTQASLCSVPVRVLGYASVDAVQGDRNRDFQRQAQEVVSECERRGLWLVEFVHEREPQHQRPLERPGLGYALGRIAAGEADGIVVSELSRLTHSVPELGRLMDWFSRHHARVVAADPGLDTDEEAGRLTMQTIIEVSRWERQRLIERTRSGMQAARRSGPASVADNPELRQRIVGMRAAGMTLQAIADRLNRESVPTVRGGAKWRPSSVQAAAGYRRPSATQRLEARPQSRSG